MVLSGHRNTEWTNDYGTKKSLAREYEINRQDIHLRYSPAWFPLSKSYKNELLDAIGHWFTNATPSAQLEDLWFNPCQCCKG